MCSKSQRYSSGVILLTLDDLENQGYIKRLPINTKKIQESLRLAQRDITTAKTILEQDTDWAFTIAYNSMLQTLRGFMFSRGYRPSGHNPHISVVRFAELFLEEDMVLMFDRMRRKRHISVYDTVGTISQKEAEIAIETAEKILRTIEMRIGKR